MLVDLKASRREVRMRMNRSPQASLQARGSCSKVVFFLAAGLVQRKLLNLHGGRYSYFLLNSDIGSAIDGFAARVVLLP